MENKQMLTRKRGFYEKYVKRLLDIICALLAIILFSPVILNSSALAIFCPLSMK